MHDTRLHTEPDEFVFVRRSRPLDYEIEWFRQIKVHSSAERSLDGERKLAYHHDEYGQMSEPKVNLFNPEIGLRVLQRLYNGPKAKNNFDDEPSKSTEQ